MAKRKQASEQAPVTPGETAPELPKAGIKAKEKALTTARKQPESGGRAVLFRRGSPAIRAGGPRCRTRSRQC